MRRGLPLVACVLIAGAGAGAGAAACAPITVRVPGVLDMRSDGMGAPVDGAHPTTSPIAQREGLDEVFGGRGLVLGPKGHVEVEGRTAWLVRSWTIAEAELAQELAPALTKERALRDVTVGDGMNEMDCGLCVCTMLVPVVNLGALAVLPTSTVALRGVRIVPGGTAPSEGEKEGDKDVEKVGEPSDDKREREEIER